MRALDLFSGIGGFALACEGAGIETVAFCEIEPFCQSVLRKHWPDIPIHSDIRTLHPPPETEIDIIVGGFPCQPYSVAGKRRGAADDRDLWPEMRRVIGEFKPRWVCAENTPGFIGMGLDPACVDLEALGYEVGAVVLPALGVGAPHIRQRLFIVAHAIEQRVHVEHRGCRGESGEGAVQPARDGADGVVADSDDTRLEGRDRRGMSKCSGEQSSWASGSSLALAAGARCDSRQSCESRALRNKARWAESQRHDWWCVEPNVGRVADGVPHRVHRLKALGNAVVPMQVMQVLCAIRKVDDALRA